MTMLQQQPIPAEAADKNVLLPALRAGVVGNGSSSRVNRRKVGFGRVRILDWGYRPFRVY